MHSFKVFHELSVAAEISFDRAQSCAAARLGCEGWQRDRAIALWQQAGAWLAYHKDLLWYVSNGMAQSGTNWVAQNSNGDWWDAIGGLEWYRYYVADAANVFQSVY